MLLFRSTIGRAGTLCHLADAMGRRMGGDDALLAARD
jgi:hypothetical protein